MDPQTIVHLIKSLASDADALDVIRRLSPQEFDYCNQSELQESLIEVACLNGFVKLLSLCLERDGRSFGSEDKNAVTCAAKSETNSLEMLGILHHYGYDLLETPKRGPSAIGEAARRGDVEAVQYLMKHGADPLKPFLFSYGYTSNALLFAVERGHFRATKAILDQQLHKPGLFCTKVPELLASLRSPMGLSPMDIAIEQNDSRLVGLFVEYGADVKAAQSRYKCKQRIDSTISRILNLD